MSIYRITVEVEVEDAGELLAYATDRYRECWGGELVDGIGKTETLIERALIEALLFSNENPSPAEYGIGFTGESSIKLVSGSHA